MIAPGSRYEASEHFFVKAHLYNEWGYPLLEGEIGLTSLVLKLQGRETLYVWVSLPQYAPLTTIFAKEGDILPGLASKVYSDCRRWTDIAAANPQVWYPLDVKMGDQLRIPD